MSILTESEPAKLWVNVKRKDGTGEYKTLFNCTDIARWEKEEAELAKKFTTAFIEWNKIPANQQLLKYDANNKDGCGFKFVDGDFEYKLLEFTKKDGSGTFKTLGKRKMSGGGYGGGSKSYSLLRTTHLQIVRLEEIPQMLDSQGENDNYQITYIRTDEKGDLFQVEKKEAYIPKVVTTTTPSTGNSDGSKEETEEATS